MREVAARHAAWRRANPGQAEEQDDLRADCEAAAAYLRAEGAPPDEIAGVWESYRAELDAIRGRYAGGDAWDDGPHTRGIWEL